MYSLSLLAAASFLLSFLLTPLVRNLSIRWGVLDQPDHQRKIHHAPIPRVGGISIALAYILPFELLLLLPLSTGPIFASGLPLAYRVFPATALVFLFGLFDDLRGIQPWQKLAGQLAAACVAFWAGVQITALAGYQLPPWLSLPVTLLWLVGCSNAFNLIDGVDGLAAGAGLFATITILLGALLDNNVPLALATVPLAGALAGFLRYNFNPASIFLGDSGSLTVGFLLGCYGVLWGHKSTAALGMTAPLMALAVPLLDTAIAIARRFLRRQPIFSADRGHIHHRLLDRGLTPRRAVLLLYAACGGAAALSLLASVAHNYFGGVAIVLFCAAAWIGIQHLGYTEFNTASRMLLAGAFRRLLNAQLRLNSFRDTLTAATTPDECWQAIRQAYPDFGFFRIDLALAGRIYTHNNNGNHEPRYWTVKIRLSDDDYIELSREYDTEAPPAVAPFADTLTRILQNKLPTLSREPRAKAAYV